MRFKVGKTWFQCAVGQPMMVEFTEQDLKNIANMVEGATRYATFDDDEGLTKDQMREWMDEYEGTFAKADDLVTLSNTASNGPWEVRSLPKPEHINDDEEFDDWSDRHSFLQAPRNEPTHPYDIEIFSEDRNERLYPPKQARADLELTAALVNLYRAGKLVVLP